MWKFVDKVAGYLKDSGLPYRDWVVVLPSDRARVYTLQALYRAEQKPLFAPDITTISQFVQNLSSQSILDKTRLTLLLFEVHKEIEKNEHASFDEFLSWSPTLLSDFDEIDRYLVDHKQLFKNLQDVKEIENWSFGNEHLSENQKRFMEFWDRLPKYYQLFQEKLAQLKACYFGAAFKEVAENIQLITAKYPGKRFLFAGFNALSAAESSLFKQLKSLGLGEILVDADAFYVDDHFHEAGLFLRNNLKDWNVPSLPFTERKLHNKAMKLELISCSQLSGQAKVAASILSKLSPEQFSETLVLLADEKLIVSVLNNLPDRLKKVNITLGLPLKNSPVKSWVETLFKIQERFQKYPSKKVSIYYKELFSLWRHPFVTGLLNPAEREEIQRMELDLKQKNAIYFSMDRLTHKPVLSALFDLIYKPWKGDYLLATQTIREINQYIYRRLSELSTYEKALLDGFDTALVDFENCAEEGFPEMSLKTYQNLLNQQWKKASIAYFGNPTEGLQIMGLLETRLLDFKKIIVLGLNEGNIPKTNPISSIIPMDLRRYFHLPTPREKQGLFAHHFYRLLHTCEDMTITYYKGTDGMNQGEESRYVNQLKLELAKVNKNIALSEKYYTIKADKAAIHEAVTIEKNEAIFARLDQLFSKGISASAINSYLYCPLNFYYERILKFSDEKSIEEEIEANTFGTFIHNVLEKLYTPFARREKDSLNPITGITQVTFQDLEAMKAKYPALLQAEFFEFYNGNETVYTQGKNYIHYTIASEILKKFFDFEIHRRKTAPDQHLFIEGLELKLTSTMDLEVHGRQVKVNLVGLVDRIDDEGEKIRIYDYKTGSVDRKKIQQEKKQHKGSDFELMRSLAEEPKLFQLMTYAYLYYMQFKVVPDEVAIIPLAKLNEGIIAMKGGHLDLAQIVELYPELIQSIIAEIYDPNTPFSHEPRFSSYCKYCEN